MTIRIVLVDDQQLVRAGFRMMLQAEPGLSVVGEAEDGLDALAVLERVDADVVLMDVRMPRMDGVEATRRLRARGERPRILMLTTFDLDEYAFSALRAGARGFLLKDVSPAELMAAIQAVDRGDAVVAPSTTARLLDHVIGHLPAGPPGEGVLAALTSRERDVLTYLTEGLSNNEIADRMFVSEATVKTHVGRMLTKLGLRDRLQAVVFAYSHGLAAAHPPPVKGPPDG